MELCSGVVIWDLMAILRVQNVIQLVLKDAGVGAHSMDCIAIDGS